MGKNINQLTTEATSFQSSDKLYLGRSPYGATDDRYFYYSTLSAQIGNGFVTVGGSGGAQYPTYYDAWTAGKFNTYQISDTTETQQFTFTGTHLIVNAIAAYSVIANFGNFNISGSASVNFYSRGVQWQFTTPTTAAIYLGSGTQLRMQDGLLSTTSSTPYFRINGVASFVPTLYFENMQISVTGATNDFGAASMNFYMIGGTLAFISTAGTNFVNSSSGTVYFSPKVITGSPASGTLINAGTLYINNVINQTTNGTGPINYIATNINANNYYDYNFNTAPSSFFPNTNGNCFLNNVKTLGTATLSGGSFINITNSVLDSFLDGATTLGGTVWASNTQWIASSGTFTFVHTGSGPKDYSFNNCSFAANTVVANNDTRITNAYVTGNFSINNNISGVYVDGINASGTITDNGNYNTIDGFNCTNATITSNSTGSSLINTRGVLTGGITVTSGCTDCSVINTKATVGLVDNGTNTQKGFNLP